MTVKFIKKKMKLKLEGHFDKEFPKFSSRGHLDILVKKGIRVRQT